MAPLPRLRSATIDPPMPHPATILLESLDRVVARSCGEAELDRVDVRVRTATTALHLTNLGELVEQSRSLAADGAIQRLREVDPGVFDGVIAQPVLTAHPTEARRLAVLRRLEGVRSAVETVLGGSASSPDESRAGLDLAVEMLWRTDSVRHAALTVADEVAFAEAFLWGPLADAAITVESIAQPGATAAMPARLRLGSWIGGDQDGNPYCTSTDLQRALRGSEEIARARHRAFADEAARTLTVPSLTKGVDPGTQRWLRIHAPDRIARRHPGEALRLVAEVIAERVDRASAEAYISRAEIATDIERIATELERGGLAHLVEPLLGRWRAWCRLAGLHLLDLDLRTHSSVLRGIAEAATGETDRLWDDPAGLLAALLPTRPRSDGDGHDQLLDALSLWSEILLRSPDRGGSLVVSGCRSAAEMMVALWLLRAYPPLDRRVRISPLFEDEEALAGCGEALRRALLVPEYAEHLGSHLGMQEVTLGYSDTTKATGYLSGALALRRAHSAVAEACRERDARPIIFHGRGGTVARGGGPTAEAVLAQPPRTLDGRLRWTEQGESIGLRFDDPVVGATHLAETLLALASSADGGGDGAAQPDWLVAAAARSREVYEAWYEDPDLAHFHRAFTPIDAIERLAIGSRPPRRSVDPAPRALRAIPWHFSWSQTRVVASVWFGAGSGLRTMVDAADVRAEARGLYRASTWFRSTVDNLEMVAFKTDWGVAEVYATLALDAGAGRWLPRIREEWESCVDAILAIREGRTLLEHQADLRDRILARGDALRPLHELQVSLLGQWRRDGDAAVLRLVHGTVNGIAAGVQNTG